MKSSSEYINVLDKRLLNQFAQVTNGVGHYKNLHRRQQQEGQTNVTKSALYK